MKREREGGVSHFAFACYSFWNHLVCKIVFLLLHERYLDIFVLLARFFSAFSSWPTPSPSTFLVVRPLFKCKDAVTTWACK